MLSIRQTNVLRLWIDFQYNEYTPLQFRTSGKVVIHEATNLPNPEWSGLNIEPGFFYKIKIQQLTKELLPAPYQTNCIDYSKFPRDMRSNAKLDQESCVDECLLNHTINICGCTFMRLALSYNRKICESEESLKGSSCEKNDKFCVCYAKKEAAKHCPHLCKLSCKQVYYEEKGLEILNWPGSIKKISNYYNYTNLTEARKTVASVQIFFTTMETTTRKYQPKYHFVEIFSYLGGFVGLWLGVSLLNIFEYIKDEALCLARCVRKIKKKSVKHGDISAHKE
ncbi:amiloride-sensitive sodium channel subunit alpha-like [Centruroides sculpturatus]|uniref:amiloride-sensitive sodium channel subunit alpha-like n=1 Tax=Centruroides sculpturatus TaxID=218467 RepID=UPI000C6E7A14|nr:amiloride-sensitive sodium channel subunit alpha-like [Centruroides sculpturatus]